MNSLYLENEEIQNNQLNKESIGPGLYMMDICKKMNGIVYPWAPTVRLQKMGGSINQDMSLIDTESDLFNIVNINSNDPNKKYIPDPNKKVQYQDLKDGFFHEESTLLNNPPSELRGLTKNRFYKLNKNPQDSALEPDKFVGSQDSLAVPAGQSVPFTRIGEDTYLQLIDNYEDC